MKGLELARRYYETYGREMLQTQFADVLSALAVGLAGSGSECYGYDDEASWDHDFEPAFCIFLPSEEVVDRKTEFRLERAYSKLPNQFMGFERSPISPVGGSRHGVIRMDRFFLEKVGDSDGNLSIEGWFSAPEYGLLEATNGEIFSDPCGQISLIRKKLSYFPEDVRLKKLAGNLLLMGQAGQYNYGRCILRGESGAAQLAVFEFAKSAMHCIYLINRSYMPYYKWCFKGLENLPLLSELSQDLEYLISSANTAAEAKKKMEIIEHICAGVSKELTAQEMIDLQTQEMEQLAYAVNDTISDHHIRNLHILHGV